jgi:hypothetical protein
MGAYAGPNISEDGLVLALDAGNSKSLNIPTQSDHGYADWYCLVSGTVTYSIINSTGGIIYERNGSTVTTMATATGPQRGTFSITAGRFYYGSVPINLVVEDGHERIVPLTMAGTQFWCVAVRNNPSTYYVYSPYQATTVNFYDNTSGGLTGTPTSTLSLSAGQSGTFTSNNLTNHWISSNVPIIATATQTGWDRTILSPMSTYVYQRFQNNFGTTNFTTPTNNNTYVTYDSTYKVMNMSIADGSGGDCAQGLGLEYLSDTYSWGNVLSDYTMVFPYNGTFTSSYWNGSTWVVWDTHTVTTGSITNPPRITRDGTNGPGVEASALSGLSANMASGATLWKWEGTAPFYLAINDNTDDEFSVLGWNSSTQNTPRSSNIITDISGRGNNGTLLNGPIFVKDNLGVLSFDGVNDYITSSFATVSGQAVTYAGWLYSTETTATYRNFVDSLTFRPMIWWNTLGQIEFDAAFYTTTTVYRNQWVYVALSKPSGSSAASYYVNGSLVGTGSAYTTPALTPTWFNRAAAQTWKGNAAQVSVYNRALTAQEIQQNYIATKSRFGL